MASVRERRLSAEFESVTRLIASSGSTIELASTSGRPPVQYVLTYRCPGIVRLIGGQKADIKQSHSVQIDVPASYPGQPPIVRFLTPIFHPHVWSATNLVCIGKWTISEQLDQLLLRIGALIQYDPQYFDFKSPANTTAAEWAARNMRLFPLGSVTFKRTHDVGPAIDWKELK